jgi:hypothetical protein
MTHKKGKIIKFEGVGKKEDVYNPSVPFVTNKGLSMLAARVEERKIFVGDKNYIPQTKFFIQEGELWKLAEDMPTFQMEDPFVCHIGDQFILGGVEIFPEVNGYSFRTVFFKGKDVYHLQKFAYGPKNMKDIRLVDLPDGKIGVFTRPQGGIYKKGRIGFTTINYLEEINDEKKMLRAKIVRGNLQDNEWEGVNQATLLEDGQVRVLAHLAKIDTNKNKEYKGTIFRFNPEKRKVAYFKVIATRDDFPETPTKCKTLKKVVFTSGVVEREDSHFDYIAGLSDARSGVKEIHREVCHFTKK